MLSGLIKPLALAGVVGVAVKGHLEFNRLAEKWRPLIKKYADQHGISQYILASILFQESRFDPQAVGSAGERGMGQFKPIASADVQVDHNELIGSPELQIDASARLIALSKKRAGGDMFLAVRSYNAGYNTAKNDLSAGAVYALEVFKNALVDFLFGVVSGEVHG